MPPKIVAIHQPNLFPWLGFFSKILKSDTFVFLNHVVNNPRTALYTKRVQIILNGEEHWLTLPLKNVKGETFIPINTMEIDNPVLIASKHLKTIELNYKKAPFFSETFEYILPFYEHKSPLISERNIDFILAICKRLEIQKEFLISSDLNCTNHSTEMLIEILKKTKGTTYLSGDGAEGYQEEALYNANDIYLEFSNYQHPTYPQSNTSNFKKGLSIIDVLMNIGFEETKNLLLLSLQPN
jgi:hypothetical protein